MSAIIKAEGLSKRYIIGHQQDRYLTLRDAMAQKAKDWGKRILHPMRASSGQPLSGLSTTEEFWALNDISFEVQQGDRIGIIGRNGAGKSTLLKILSRITEPTSGRVTINGRIASLLEVGTGFHPELSGRENIFLNGAILGMTRAEIKRKFDEIVDFAEVERFLDTPVKRYSSGMYVRLAFAVAAHLEPEILIIDEVLAVGDAQFQSKCLGKMEEVGKEGRTVLFVSHNMNAINRLCTQVILLKDGQIVCKEETAIAVQKYLQGSNQQTVCEAVFRNNPDKPFQVSSVSVCTADGAVLNKPLNVNESFKITATYSLDRPMHDGYGVISLRNSRGEAIWYSDSRDCPQSARFDRTGNLGVVLSFPPLMLVPGIYTVTLSVAMQGTGAEDAHQEVLEFEIVDLTGVRPNRPGCIYHPLEWERVT